MRKFLCLIYACIGIVGIAIADTLNVTWHNTDGTTYDTTMCTVGGTLNLPTTPTKRGYTFNGWIKTPYIPIEYIESTGTQYIDTGYIMTSDIVEYGITIYGRAPSDTSLFGSETSSYPKYSGVPYTTNAGSTSLFIGSKGSLSAETFPENQWNEYIVATSSASAGRLTLNNDVTSLSSSFSYEGGIQKTRSIYLFGNNIYSGVGQLTKVKVSSFYIKDNGTLVRDIIPVLDLNGVACMYDKVSKTLFYNAGTGDFIAGPAIQ